MPETEINNPTYKGVNLNNILSLAYKGNTTSDIGKIVGCSQQNIAERLKPYREALEESKIYTQNEAIFDGLITWKLAKQLVDMDVKNIKPGHVTSWAIAKDKYRLSSGQSTQNISVRSRSEDIDNKLAEMMNRLEELE